VLARCGTGSAADRAGVAGTSCGSRQVPALCVRERRKLDVTGQHGMHEQGTGAEPLSSGDRSGLRAAIGALEDSSDPRVQALAWKLRTLELRGQEHRRSIAA
jgi:hypothetical protein